MRACVRGLQTLAECLKEKMFCIKSNLNGEGLVEIFVRELDELCFG